MKKFLSLLITITFISTIGVNLFAAGAAAADTLTYYVDADAPDGGDGTAEKPFTNIIEARNALRNCRATGDLSGSVDIVFADGTYFIDETVLFTKADSGSSALAVTYRADDAANVIFTGASSPEDGTPTSVLSGSLIDIDGASHLSFEGITFTDSLNAPQIRISGNNITLKNCTVSNAGFTKAVSYASDRFAVVGTGSNITVTNCEIYNACGGVSIAGGDRKTLTSGNNVINSNYIHHLSETAVSVAGVGAEVSGNEIQECAGSGIVFTGNDHKIEFNALRSSAENPDVGVISSVGGATCYGNEIRCNFICGGNGTGISLPLGLSGAVVYGNIIKDMPEGIYLGGGRGLTVENNIIINDSSGTAADVQAIFYDSSARSTATASASGYASLAAQFSDIPYSTGVWAQRYPELAKVKVPAALSGVTDKNDSSLFFNPSGSVIRNNAFYISGNVKSMSFTVAGDQINGTAYQQRYGNILNNILLPRDSMSDFPAAEFGNYALKPSGAVFNALADFENIPFNKIGISGISPKITFTDVQTSEWYYKWVVCAVSYGLMSGTDTWGGSFSPSVTTSRAMIVQILYNLEGKPSVEYKDIFTDVAETAWYADAVIWAAENGITDGVSETAFAPDMTVTREQVAVFLYRYLKDYKGEELSEGAGLDTYSDVGEISNYPDFREALSWAVAEGIVTGKESGGEVYLAPKDSAQRCEAAAIFGRFYIGVA